jgi:hypothetical protein
MGSDGIAVADVELQGGHNDWECIGQRLRWDEAHAWALTAGSVTAPQTIEISIAMPQDLYDWDQYAAVLAVARDVWVIAFYEEADGKAGILLPNGENPQLFVAKGERRPLPTIQVSLRDANIMSREKFVVFAFADKEDYAEFRPPAGAISDDEATAYYRSMRDRLATLPPKRWGRAEMAYVIRPKTNP